MVAIAFAVLVSLVLAALLVFWRDAAVDVVGLEGYKILLQFILVVVLGGGVSIVYQAVNREADLRAQRARQEEERALVQREARQRYLRELVEQYNAVKRSRRMLRAQALVRRVSTAECLVRVAKYDEFLQVVLDAQLSLEALSLAIRADDELFPERNDLATSIGDAETYLRTLVTEYEQAMPAVDVDQVMIDLPALPLLAVFIGPYGEAADFREQFVEPMQHVLTVVQRLLLA